MAFGGVMKFKKLVFEQNNGDWFAETFHNVLVIFKRDVKNIVGQDFEDTFVLTCFGSVFEFKTFEEAEIKANEENQKHLEKNIGELSKYFESEFTIIDVCPKCGKITVTTCKHNSCYNNQCECGYLSGFIGRNHAN